VIVSFIDIGEIVDHHCLYFLFIIVKIATMKFQVIFLMNKSRYVTVDLMCTPVVIKCM
jgi:hypothetical protein